MNKQTKAVAIRALLAKGKPAKEIAALTGVTVQYVYGVRYYDKVKKAKAQEAKAAAPKAPSDSAVLFITVKKLNNLHEEIADLKGKLRFYTTMPLWQRIKFVFTGRV